MGSEMCIRDSLLVDCSKSMRYGEETGRSKFDYAATAAASLAVLMQQQADSVGMVLFSNQIDKTLRNSSHPSHIKAILHELQEAEPENATDVSDPFMALASQLSSRGMVILFSDLFLDPEELGKSLQQFRLRRHEVIVFHVMHHDELEFPFEDNTLFRGLEVDAELHTEPRALRKSYLEAVERYMERIKKVCGAAGIDHVLLDTSKSLGGVLASYLNFRAKSRRKLR